MSDVNFEDMIVRQILAELSYFDGADFRNPSITASLNTTTMMTLVEIRDENPGFDAKAEFSFGPDPVIKITWWIGFQGKTRSFEICLDPLEVRRDLFDPIAAYERAMGIL